MQDSLLKCVMPLSTDKFLQRSHCNVFGSIRMGRLLEAMDAFAACVAYGYCVNPARASPSPFTLVTAMVDEIVPRLSDAQSDVDNAQPNSPKGPLFLIALAESRA